MGVLAFTFLKPSTSLNPSPFPDEIYLDAPSSLNGDFVFKGRVISQLGRNDSRISVRFSVIETSSGQPLDVAVIVPDALMTQGFTPGQIYAVGARANGGNMIAVEMAKY